MDSLISFIVVPSFGLALLFSLRPQRQRWLEWLLIAGAVGGTLAVVALRGHRWQFVTLYALAIGSSLVLGLRRPWQRLAAVAALAGLAGSALILWGFPVSEGLAPTGPYPVGTSLVHWRDAHREEPFTEDASDTRELMVQLWYPALTDKRHRLAPYFDHPELRAGPLADSLGLPTFTTAHLDAFRSHSYLDAQVRTGDGPWPVIVFSHGLEGTRAQNTTLMESLASEGYVVAAVDHTFDSFLTIFPDGRQADFRSDVPSGLSDDAWLSLRGGHLETRVADASFVLDQLTALSREDSASRFAGKLDLEAVGIVGHSFGGATVVLAALSDPRWRVAVALDGWFVPLNLPDARTTLEQPFLYIGQDRWPEWNEKRQRRYLALLMAHSPRGYRLSLPETNHHDYTDLPLFSPLTRWLGLTGTVKPTRVVSLVNAQVLSFFDHYLRGRNTELFAPESMPPEVNLENTP
jgi:predicted dienelactone hydrolase